MTMKFFVQMEHTLGMKLEQKLIQSSRPQRWKIVICGTEKWQIFSIKNQQIFAIPLHLQFTGFIQQNNFNLFISSSKFANFMNYMQLLW